MRHIDLFSGIGGFALASSWVWGDEYENVGHSEVEPYACKVYHQHFKSECLGDITKIEWKEGQADLITGGFPCQPHSVAGKRKGAGDERDLWSECVRAISVVRPRFALFENVSALLISESGRFFERVLYDLAAIGYDAEWADIPSAYVGAPSLRARIWIIAYPGDSQERRASICGGAYQEERDLGDDLTIEPLVNWNGVEINRKMPEWYKGICSPQLCRVDDGIPFAVDRVAGLGNAIVPQCAEVILRRIKRELVRVTNAGQLTEGV